MKFLKKSEHIIFIILAFVFVIVISFVVVYNSRLRFIQMPSNSRNGIWAKEFLESEHSRNSKSIYGLSENSTLVVRVKILDKRIEVFGWGDTITGWEQFYVYRLKILDVYKNFLNNNYTLENGNIIELFQYRKLNSEEDGELDFPNPLARVDMVYADINVGDDLVLFLITNHLFLSGLQEYHTDTRFARLRHTRINNNGRVSTRSNINRNEIVSRIRGVPNIASLFILTNQVQGAYKYNPYGNVFESVNPHNNLTLTREDLILITANAITFTTNAQLY